MRLRFSTLVVIGAMLLVLLATYGCKGKAASEPGTSESTSGGEAPTGAGGAPSDAAEAESPWGATRAEQCRREAHPTMSSKAKKLFDEGVRAAETNNTAAAETSFQAALKRDPNAYPALYSLGVLADRAGNERDAMNYYRRSLRVLPDYAPAVGGMSTVQFRRTQVQDAVATREPRASGYRATRERQWLCAGVL